MDSDFGGTASGPIYPDDAFYERLGAFANWQVALTDRLTGSFGTRYELADLGATPVVGGAAVGISPHYQDWITQSGLIYELTSQLSLIGSAAQGFRPPNLDELTGNNPNVLQEGMDLPSLGLVPEESWQYEVGLRADTHRLRAETYVFWTELDNNVVPVSAGPNEFTRANQDSSLQGVEFAGEYLLDAEWSLFGNFWHIEGRNDVTGAPLSRIPPTQGTVGLRWSVPQRQESWEVYSWLVRGQDRLDPVRDLSDERIPPGGTPGYGTVNLRWQKSWGVAERHRLTILGENLTDRGYLVHGSGVFGTGISARIGYTLSR